LVVKCVNLTIFSQKMVEFDNRTSYGMNAIWWRKVEGLARSIKDTITPHLLQLLRLAYVG